MESTAAFEVFAARLREFISQSSAADPGKDLFNGLARELFALQYQHNEPYRRYCQARRVTPLSTSHWTRIPAVPATAFKELDLTFLPAQERTSVFHSSGTSARRPGRHFHNEASLSIYETSLWSWFEAHLVQGFPPQTRLLALTPSHQDAPQSSLAWMFGAIERRLRSQSLLTSAATFVGQVGADGNWALDSGVAITALRGAIEANQPVMILGTAFLFVHLLDELAARNLRLRLPAGSRAMETGGYKGRSRELNKSDLHALISQTFGIPSTHIISEYGMSELSSQAYEITGLPDHGTTRPQDLGTTRPDCIPPSGTTAGKQCHEAERPNANLNGSRFTFHSSRAFRFPPWARVQIISPESGAEVREGETGLIRVFDLANVYSVMAIQTEDLGIRTGCGFELIGRADLAEPRGCSLMAG